MAVESRQINYKMLPVNTIHVWYGNIFSEYIDKGILSDVEKYTAMQFPHILQRNKYIYSHVMLRRVLSLYLNCEPEDVEFTYNKFGKPFVNNELFFNLSHTSKTYAIAISSTNEVGVDIESTPKTHTMSELKDYFLSKDEIDTLEETTSPEDIEHKLLTIWTQKEAITKAIGHELQNSLQYLNLPQVDNEFIYNHNDLSINVREFLNTSNEVGTVAALHDIAEVKILNNPNIFKSQATKSCLKASPKYNYF